MARAGFAGSVIVEAGWKGKNLRKGFKNAQKQTNDFARSMRRILVGAAAIGGGVLASRGLVSLIKGSNQGAAAWNKFEESIMKVKTEMARLLAGPAAAVLKWATDMIGRGLSWTGQFKTVREMLTSIYSGVMQKIFDLVSKLVGMIREIVTKASGIGSGLRNVLGMATGGGSETAISAAGAMF
tara:strand:- start:2349 stop:2897 length:549 start_codon:yes stop_codon:yes gene_type:complete